MNNKLGGILILFFIALVSFIFYWYYYIFSLTNIVIESNIDNYILNFDSKNTSFIQECSSNICEKEKVSPFEYTIIGEKPGYKNIEIIWTPRKSNNKLEIFFEKDFQLERVDTISQKKATEILEEKISDEDINIQQRINELKIKQNLHVEISGEDSQYYFIKSGEKLILLEDQKELGTFDFFTKSEIKVMEILGNNNHLFLELGKNKYFFSKISGELKNLILEIPINYIKSTDKNGEFIFVTQKGSFVYDLYKNSFQFNSFFSDFVFFSNDGYVGVIHKDEEQKRERFIDNSSQDSLIVYYVPETKEKKILLTTDKKIKKIF